MGGGGGGDCPSPDRDAVARLRMRQKGLLGMHEHGQGQAVGAPPVRPARGLPILCHVRALHPPGVGKVGSAQDAQDACTARRSPPRRARRGGCRGPGFRFSRLRGLRAGWEARKSSRAASCSGAEAVCGPATSGRLRERPAGQGGGEGGGRPCWPVHLGDCISCLFCCVAC